MMPGRTTDRQTTITPAPKSSKHHALLIFAALVAGLLLRLWFVTHHSRIAGDTFIYGDIAKNWLAHGVYGFTQDPGIPPQPTLIRLPGYPAFLALCFTLFGVEHYTAVLYLQTLIDLLTCFLLATLAGRLFGPRAFSIALLLATLCPFTASYAAAALAETLTLLCIAVAFYAFHRWQQLTNINPAAALNRWLILLGVTLACAILLRPEQAILAAAILPAMLWTLHSLRDTPGIFADRSLANAPNPLPISRPVSRIPQLAPVLLTALLTILPLVPWTVRNWYTFHVFEPLAPRNANDPGETVPLGFERWYRTWAVDFNSTEDVYWNYDGARVEVTDLPRRAFDTDSQRAATAALLADYNQTTHATPDLDARFEALAQQRIHAHPVRFYLALPLARLVDMALRPRTETLPIPLEWWKFRDHPRQSTLALAYAALSLAYFAVGATGLYRLTRSNSTVNSLTRILLWSMIATLVLRAALLLTLDNSEPRYTLEFFPIFILAIAGLFSVPHPPERTPAKP